jgi:hypothetical protein
MGGSAYRRWLCRVAPHCSRAQFGTRCARKRHHCRGIGRYTPLTKILAIALLGRPTLNYLKKKYGLFGGLTGREG